MVTCKVTSPVAISPGTATLPCCSWTKTASHLKALPVTNLQGLSLSRNLGEGRVRRSFGASRVHAASAAGGSEGVEGTEVDKKQENGMLAQRESASTQAARGALRPLMRSLAGDLDGFFPTVRSLRQVLDTMDRMFDDPFFTPVSQGRPLMSKQLRDAIRTPWDVKEDENAYLLRLDIPGFSREQLKVYVEEGHLVIKGDQGWEEKGDKFALRNYGTFSTRMMVPENVDLN